MQVELLTNGGYMGMDACIGKQFTAVNAGEHNSNDSVRISVEQLEMAGFLNDGCVNTSLYFYNHEVRIID